MVDLAQLMQRLVDIASDGHRRSSTLIAEDNRLMQELGRLRRIEALFAALELEQEEERGSRVCHTG